MKRTFIILSAGFLLTGCMKAVEFGTYTATYDTSIWDYNEESRELVMKSDEYCGVYFDAGGKGDSDPNITYKDGENGAVVVKNKIDGKEAIIRIVKDFGGSNIEIVPAITDDQEPCIQAGYEIMNSVK